LDDVTTNIQGTSGQAREDDAASVRARSEMDDMASIICRTLLAGKGTAAAGPEAATAAVGPAAAGPQRCTR